jgi:glutamate-ammonia-ligase adenylyltransferase
MTNHGDSTPALPVASRAGDGEQLLASLRSDAALAPLLATGDGAALIAATASHSPYLARLMQRQSDTVARFLREGADACHIAVMQDLQTTQAVETPLTYLRHKKAQLALGTALADLSNCWSLARVTLSLSEFAEASVRIVLRHLLNAAMARNEYAPTDKENPEKDSGIIILGMGKLGGYELNYSSDIDLIVLYDKAKLPYAGAKNAQHFMNKLAGDLAQILQERTSDGYVFRTDLRLRPDPMSTPLAVTTAAALTYYETVGQNWERAAMIKARPIAGDFVAAESYMRELVPFIWRKTLDFATIADIHSIKRQMNIGQAAIALPGHNIKTGVGGIREIEFFAATLQLVWGGRIPELRVRGTLAALDALTEFELVQPEQRDVLHQSYHFLRKLEHRLQMRDDAQTHSLPAGEDALNDVAHFMGYAEREQFDEVAMATLHTVHGIYADSMVDSAPLAVDGNLVFTGVEADPDTLATLTRLGYGEPQRISDIIQGWHRGHRRSTRSKRSRQVLTELVPALLSALGKTANPDAAFFHFDDFIGRLPSSAQIFSLLLTRPELLSLLADILGSAPALGDTLSNDPSLLDAVLEADFVYALPSKEDLENLLTERLRYAHEYEQKMGYLRVFNNEKRFQAGVHLLKRLATPKAVGTFLSNLAEVVIQSTMLEVWAEYTKAHESLGHTPFAVLALGKLGARAMTFGSDLDIVFLYDDSSEAAMEARQHLNRVSQRLISALTLLTREGRLYEVDTRLRPGGQDGPLATSLSAFDQYFEKTAWTYEFMALTRARVVATNAPDFADEVTRAVQRHVLKPRDHAVLLHDVVDMRGRIAKEFATENPWALKHVRGGVVDIDFIAQYLTLRYGHTHPEIWHRSSRRVFETAQKLNVLPEAEASALVAAKKYLSDLMSLLRLSAPSGVITDDAPAGLKRLLVEGMRAADFDGLKTAVLAHEEQVRHAFSTVLQQTVAPTKT